MGKGLLGTVGLSLAALAVVATGSGCTGTSPASDRTELLSVGRWVWEGDPDSWSRPTDQLQFRRAELSLFPRDSFELVWFYGSKTPGKECTGEEQRGRYSEQRQRLLLVTLEQRDRCAVPAEWEEIYLREEAELRSVTTRSAQLCFDGCDDGVNRLRFHKEK